MSYTVPAPTTRIRETAVPDERRAWRWAGGLGLAHVVLMLAAFSTEGVAAVEHGSSAASVLRVYGSVSVSRVELASYAEALAFLPLLAALVVLARLLGRRTEGSRAAAQSALHLGVAYVAATFAIGFPPLTTAVFAAHHGVDGATVATVNDLRNYGFLLQVALSCAFALALGIAALLERRTTRWIGWGGVGVGVVGLVAAPFVHNAVSMLWLVWWVGLCVVCLRGGGGRDAVEHR